MDKYSSYSGRPPVKGSAKATSKKTSVLDGLWFHSWKDGKIRWQGQVVGCPSESMALIELHSWLTGCPNGKRLVRTYDMDGWSFYDSGEEMNAAYDLACKAGKAV